MPTFSSRFGVTSHHGRTVMGIDGVNVVYAGSCLAGIVGANVLARFLAGDSTLMFAVYSAVFTVMSVVGIFATLYYALSPLYAKWIDRNNNPHRPSK